MSKQTNNAPDQQREQFEQPIDVEQVLGWITTAELPELERVTLAIGSHIKELDAQLASATVQ